MTAKHCSPMQPNAHTTNHRNPDMVNEWTSNDVPSVSSLDLHNKRPDLDLGGMQFGAAVAFEAMVKHLNTHHPKPENPEQLIRMCNEADLKRTRAETDANRWRRAHSIVEGERDQARATVASLCERLAECSARAETAEARTAPAVTVADVEKAIRAEFLDEGFYLKTPVEYRVFRAVCDLLPVEAGQATDPVTEKARELYGVVHPDGFNDDWHNVTSETQDAYRRLARHVLEHEAKR